MRLKVKEKFSVRRESAENEEVERGFLLLAQEVRGWWRMSELMRQALVEIIRSASKEADSG